MSEQKNATLEMVRVASVMDPYQVVINKGAADGVRVGQTYLFLAIGPEIKDPETGDNLGKLELLRGTGRVIHVQNKISIVRSSRQRTRYAGGGAFTGGLGLAMTPANYEDLPFDGIETGDYGRPI